MSQGTSVTGLDLKPRQFMACKPTHFYFSIKGITGADPGCLGLTYLQLCPVPSTVKTGPHGFGLGFGLSSR